MYFESHRGRLGRNTQRNLGDRFIRSRAENVSRIQRLLHETSEDQGTDSILFSKLHSSARETYKNMLASALSLEREPVTWTPLWPVKQRYKPSIKTPNVVLDLPNINSGFCVNLMDWSSTNILTVAFPSSVYLWNADTSSTLRYSAYQTSCIKWNLEGTDILTASKFGSLSMVNVESQLERVQINEMRCHPICYTTCAAFHPYQPFVLVCCSKGGMTGYNTSKGMQGISSKVLYDSTITQVTFSCDGKYVAVTTSGGWVGFLTGDLDFKVLAQWKLRGPSRAVAWHPWKASYVVVADCLGHLYVYDLLSVLNSPSQEPLGYYCSAYYSAILALAFNPLSAELVISQRLYNSRPGYNILPEDDMGVTQLSVLASLDRVVDHIKGHTGRVHYLNWSPDGTKLATSGSDESARIWDFLSKKTRWKENKKTCYQAHQSQSRLYRGLEEKFCCSLR